MVERQGFCASVYDSAGQELLLEQGQWMGVRSLGEGDGVVASGPALQGLSEGLPEDDEGFGEVSA